MALNYTPLPVGLNNKEAEPVRHEQTNIRMTVEHKQLDQEITPHVQVHEETVEVPSDLQEMGVQATPTSYFETQQEVIGLIPDAEIVEGLKQPPSSSFRWLAELARYLLRRKRAKN